MLAHRGRSADGDHGLVAFHLDPEVEAAEELSQHPRRSRRAPLESLLDELLVLLAS